MPGRGFSRRNPSVGFRRCSLLTIFAALYDYLVLGIVRLRARGRPVRRPQPTLGEKETMTDQSDGAPQPAGVTPPAPAAAAPPAAPSAETLKAAFKAYKKRLKLTQLDDASRIGRAPNHAGGHSSIAGITPPDQYPKAVWEALADQGKLRRAGHGTYAAWAMSWPGGAVTANGNDFGVVCRFHVE